MLGSSRFAPKYFGAFFVILELKDNSADKKKKRNTFPPRSVSLAFSPQSHLKGMLMLHFYTTDNVTQNQEAYNTFIESFIPLLASVPCPKCGMIGLLILYGTHPRCFINEDMTRIKIMIQRVRCNNCGSTHVVLPTTVLPYFLHIILNIQNALKSDTEMNITYKDYLKRRFKFSALEPFPVFTRFYSTIHSIIKNRNKKRIYFGFFMSPTHLR